MRKKVAILQSNYIPWKGYFDQINMVDEFIIYDDVQYTRRDWRNRNKIVTPNGLSWLTIPVHVKGKFSQNINETVVEDSKWAKKHWNSLVHNYKKSQYFWEYMHHFESIYIECASEVFLSKINYQLIKAANALLGITTSLKCSSDFNAVGNPSERLLDICKKTGATTYLSGPAAMNYLDTEMFIKNGVSVEWMDYTGYPVYNQMYKPFEHGVSILDLIFNEGPNAIKYMKTFGC